MRGWWISPLTGVAAVAASVLGGLAGGFGFLAGVLFMLGIVWARLR